MEQRTTPTPYERHATVKETDMIAAKLDLLIKKLDEGSKQQVYGPVHAMD